LLLFYLHYFQLYGISSSALPGLITGLIEVTNGIFCITQVSSLSIYLKAYLVSFLLGFGGISVLLQTLSITSKAKISIKPYFLGKFLQGTIALFYTVLLL
jgi:hypothetical protein